MYPSSKLHQIIVFETYPTFSSSSIQISASIYYTFVIETHFGFKCAKVLKFITQMLRDFMFASWPRRWSLEPYSSRTFYRSFKIFCSRCKINFCDASRTKLTRLQSCEAMRGRLLAKALVQMHIENSLNMPPDSIYSVWNYSHPTFFDWLSDLRGLPSSLFPVSSVLYRQTLDNKDKKRWSFIRFYLAKYFNKYPIIKTYLQNKYPCSQPRLRNCLIAWTMLNYDQGSR